MPTSYTCPFCGKPTTITDSDVSRSWDKLDLLDPAYGPVGINVTAVTCPDPECKQMKLIIRLTKAHQVYGDSYRTGDVIDEWQLLPESSAKVLPDYVPDAIKSDYVESCRIQNLSPKASATLARRCLQGMIRDFWKVSKPRLVDEIKALETLVDGDTWEAIDAVRTIGNIGAHMERDIDTIIEVDPEEAQLLISLIETLVDDWYVVRAQRQERLEKVKEVAAAKAALKQN